MRRGHRVTGLVQSFEHFPAPGFTIEAESAESETMFYRRPDPFRATTAADGRFEILLAPAGPMQLMASSPTGSVNVRAGLLVPDDGDSPPVVITLPDRRGSLTVHVVDANGTAVVHAKIDIQSGPPVIDTVATGATDERGTAKFEGLPVDQVTVHVLASNSTVMSYGVGAADLQGGDVIFRLESGEVGGQALRGDGSPARVRLALERLIPPVMERGEAIDTDDEGRFHFSYLPAGGYQFHVEGDENILIASRGLFTIGETDLRVWIVGTAEASRYHLEFVLVDDATGEPIRADAASADIVLSSGTSRWRHTESSSGPVSEPGRFVSLSPLPPGTYDVTVTSVGWRSARIAGVKIPRAGEPPVVRLDHGRRVEGRLSSADGAPIEGVRVDVGRQSATSAADGTFSLNGLDVGVDDARVMGDTVIEETRKFTVPATGVGRLDWTLKPAGVLAIRFGASPDASRERVAITPLFGGESKEEEIDPGVSWNDEHEGPRWKGLAPGRYRVTAWQGKLAHPAQEIDIRAREWTVVRFPPAAASVPPK